MLISHLPQTLARINAALADWHTTTAEPPYPSLSHRDHEWTQGGEQVRLSVWDSAANATVTIEYYYGGAIKAHLELSTPNQVLGWLRIVGAVVPSQAELAEAMLTPDAGHQCACGGTDPIHAVAATGDPDWYIAQQAQDVMWHREGAS